MLPDTISGTIIPSANPATGSSLSPLITLDFLDNIKSSYHKIDRLQKKLQKKLLIKILEKIIFNKNI